MRETRYLLLGNLGETVREERIEEHFRRYGKIDKVRFLSKRGGDNSLSAYVAFMDIRSAQKAKTAVNVIGDRELITEYFDPAMRSANEEGPRQQQVTHSRNYRRYDGGKESTIVDDRGIRERPASHERSYQPSEAGNSYDSDRSRSRVDVSEIKQHSHSSSKKRSGVKSLKKKQTDEIKGKIKKDKQKKTKERGRSPTVKQRKSYTSSGSSPSGSGGKIKESSSDGRSSSDGSVSRSISDGRRSSSASSSSSSGSSNSSKTHRTHSDSSGSSLEIEEKPESRKLVAMCIRKLPARPTITSLRDGIFHEFKKYGKVKSVLVRGDGADRHALVLFRTAAEAHKAIAHARTKLLFGAAIEASIYEGEVSGQELEECGGIIDEFHPRASRTLFVGNLDKTVGYSDIQNIFVRFGEIVAIEIKKQHNIPQYAFLQYTDIMSVVRAITKMDGEKLGRNTLKLGFGKTVISSCLWVDGVTDSFTENYLASCFQRYGPVKHVVIDRSRGQALVFYAQYDYAQSAMQKMRARKLNGSRLKMDYASNELVEIFLKHMKSSGQSFQGLESIRQLLQPPSSPVSTPIPSGSSSSGYGRSSIPQESRSTYYEERHQSSYNEEQYTDGNYRRGWRARSRERHNYPSEQPSSFSRPKRNYDDSYSRPDYHRESTWEHDNYGEGRSRVSQYDQDYRQRDYDFRRDQARGYTRKPSSRGSVPYEESFRYRGSRDRYRDERDVDSSRDPIGDRYYSRSVHLSPSHPRYHPRRSRSISPLPRDSDRYGLDRGASGDAPLRRRESCSPDIHYDSIHRMNSMESKSSSHSESRYPSRSGDVDMREYMDDDKLSVSSPHSDERIVEFTEKAKKLCVRKRVTTDISMQDSMSPKMDMQYNYRTEGDSTRKTYGGPVWQSPSNSPANSEHCRSRSGTPTRDENEDLIGEVIIKKSGTRNIDKPRDEPKTSYRSTPDNRPCDKDYRKEFPGASIKLDSSSKSRSNRSSTASLLQRVHSPTEVDKKTTTSYGKDFDYRKHSSTRTSKQVTQKLPKRSKNIKSDAQTRYTETGSDYDQLASPTDRASTSSSSNLLKREYSPKSERRDRHPPKKMKVRSASKEKIKERGREDHKKRVDDKLLHEDRSSHSQKRKYSSDQDSPVIRTKRDRKSVSDNRHRQSVETSSQKHDAPMSIASQMFLQGEEDSEEEVSANIKKDSGDVEAYKEISTIEQDVEEEEVHEDSSDETLKMFSATLSAAKSLLPKSISQPIKPKPAVEVVSAKTDNATGKKKDGNLTELEKEKERLQKLLSKLDTEKQLDPKDAEEVADVVLKELTEKARSKLDTMKAPSKSNTLQQRDETERGKEVQSVDEITEIEQTEIIDPLEGDDVTFEEEVVVDTIEEVTEDEIIETEVEVEVTVKDEEEVEETEEDKVIEMKTPVPPPLVVSMPITEDTKKPSNIDHTQGYRKQMEARKKEIEKLEKKRESQRKKIFKMQEKEKKKQIKMVSAMRGPSQSVISSVDDEIDDESIPNIDSDNTPDGGKTDEIESFPQFGDLAGNNNLHSDPKNDLNPTAVGVIESDTTESGTPIGQTESAASEVSNLTSKVVENDELWPPDRGKNLPDDQTSADQDKSVYKETNESFMKNPSVTVHATAKSSTPTTPGSTAPNTPRSAMKDFSPKTMAPVVTPTTTHAISHPQQKTHVTQTASNSRTPVFTTPSPASSSSNSSSKSQMHKQMKMAHQRSSHSSRSGHHGNSRHHYGHPGSSSDHRRSSHHSHHPRMHSSSSSSGHNHHKSDGYRKHTQQVSRRSLATITVDLDTSPSKPLSRSELERLKQELESVRNQLKMDSVSPSSLSPCSDDEAGRKSPARLLSPVSPLLKSPGNVMVQPKKVDGSLPSTLQNSSSSTSLTDRLKLLGKVKKKAPGLIQAVKSEIPVQNFIPQDRVGIHETRVFRSSIIDQDCERLSHVCQNSTDVMMPMQQTISPIMPNVPLFSGSRFLEPMMNHVRNVEVPQPVPLAANPAPSTTIIQGGLISENVIAEQFPISSIIGPKNVRPLSSCDLPVTAERPSDSVGKKCVAESATDFRAQPAPTLRTETEQSQIREVSSSSQSKEDAKCEKVCGVSDSITDTRTDDNSVVTSLDASVATSNNINQDSLSETQGVGTARDVLTAVDTAVVGTKRPTGNSSPMSITDKALDPAVNDDDAVDGQICNLDLDAGSCMEIGAEESPELVLEESEVLTSECDKMELEDQSSDATLPQTDVELKPNVDQITAGASCEFKEKSEDSNSQTSISAQVISSEMVAQKNSEAPQKKDKLKSEKRKLSGKLESSKPKTGMKHKVTKDLKKEKSSSKKDGSKKVKSDELKNKSGGSSSKSTASSTKTVADTSRSINTSETESTSKLEESISVKEAVKVEEKRPEMKDKNEEKKSSHTDCISEKKTKVKSEKREKSELILSSSKEKSEHQKPAMDVKSDTVVKTSKNDSKSQETSTHFSKKKKKKKHSEKREKLSEKKFPKSSQEISSVGMQQDVIKKKSESQDRVKKVQDKIKHDDHILEGNTKNEKSVKIQDEKAKSVKSFTEKTGSTTKKDHKKDSSKSSKKLGKSHPELKASNSAPIDLSKKVLEDSDNKKDSGKKSHKKAEKTSSTAPKRAQVLVYSDSSSSDMELAESIHMKKDGGKKLSENQSQDASGKWSDFDEDSQTAKAHWSLSSSSSCSDAVPPPVTQSALLVTETIKNETIMPDDYHSPVFSESSSNEEYDDVIPRASMSKMDFQEKLKEKKVDKSKKKSSQHDKFGGLEKRKPKNKDLFLSSAESDSSESKLVMSLTNSDNSGSDNADWKPHKASKPLPEKKRTALTYSDDESNESGIDEPTCLTPKPQLKATTSKISEKRKKLLKSGKTKQHMGSDVLSEPELKKKKKSDRSERKREVKLAKKLEKLQRKESHKLRISSDNELDLINASRSDSKSRHEKSDAKLSIKQSEKSKHPNQSKKSKETSFKLSATIKPEVGRSDKEIKLDDSMPASLNKSSVKSFQKETAKHSDSEVSKQHKKSKNTKKLEKTPRMAVPEDKNVQIEGKNIVKGEFGKRTHKKSDKLSKSVHKKHDKRPKAQQVLLVKQEPIEEPTDVTTQHEEVHNELGFSLFGSDSDDDDGFHIDEDYSLHPEEDVEKEKKSPDEKSIKVEHLDLIASKTDLGTQEKSSRKGQQGSREGFLSSSTSDESDEEQKMAIQSAISALDRDDDMITDIKENEKITPENTTSPEKSDTKHEEKAPLRPQSLSPPKRFTEPGVGRRASHDSRDAKEERKSLSSSQSGLNVSKRSVASAAQDRRERMDKMKSISHEREEEAVRSIMGVMDESSDADSYYSEINKEEVLPPQQTTSENRKESDNLHAKSKDSDVGSDTPLDSSMKDDRKENESSHDNEDNDNEAKLRSTAEEKELAAAVSAIENLFVDFEGNNSASEENFLPPTDSQIINPEPKVERRFSKDNDGTIHSRDDEDEVAVATSSLIKESDEESLAISRQSSMEIDDSKPFDVKNPSFTSTDIELPSVRGDPVGKQHSTVEAHSSPVKPETGVSWENTQSRRQSTEKQESVTNASKEMQSSKLAWNKDEADQTGNVSYKAESASNVQPAQHETPGMCSSKRNENALASSAAAPLPSSMPFVSMPHSEEEKVEQSSKDTPFVAVSSSVPASVPTNTNLPNVSESAQPPHTPVEQRQAPGTRSTVVTSVQSEQPFTLPVVSQPRGPYLATPQTFISSRPETPKSPAEPVQKVLPTLPPSQHTAQPSVPIQHTVSAQTTAVTSVVHAAEPGQRPVPTYVDYQGHILPLPGQMIPHQPTFGIPPGRFPNVQPSQSSMIPFPPPQPHDAFQRALSNPFLPQLTAQPPHNPPQNPIAASKKTLETPQQPVITQSVEKSDSTSSSQAISTSLTQTSVPNITQLGHQYIHTQKGGIQPNQIYPHQFYYPAAGMPPPHFAPGLPYMPPMWRHMPPVHPRVDDITNPHSLPQRSIAERPGSPSYSVKREQLPHVSSAKLPVSIPPRPALHTPYALPPAQQESRQSGLTPQYIRSDQIPYQPQRNDQSECVVRSENEKSQVEMVDQHFRLSGMTGNLPAPPSHISLTGVSDSSSNKVYSVSTLQTEASPNPLMQPASAHAGIYSQGLPRHVLPMPPGLMHHERYQNPQGVPPHLWPHGASFRPPSLPQVQPQPRLPAGPPVTEDYQQQTQQHQQTSKQTYDANDQVLDLFKKYPVIWQGLLALKNDSAAVQLHFICGSKELANMCLPTADTQGETDKERNLAVLRIVQRMRLEHPQLGELESRMIEQQYCLFLALPCGRDQTDVIEQQCALKKGFIDYFTQKNAAGIVNVQHPAYVLHVFPPCDFTTKHLQTHARDLLQNINDIQHSMIVIAPVPPVDR